MKYPDIWAQLRPNMASPFDINLEVSFSYYKNQHSYRFMTRFEVESAINIYAIVVQDLQVCLALKLLLRIFRFLYCSHSYRMHNQQSYKREKIHVIWQILRLQNIYRSQKAQLHKCQVSLLKSKATKNTIYRVIFSLKSL